MATFGDKIKELRTEKGLTQEQFAEILGLAQSTIGMIETNKREVSNSMLVKIADYFNVSTDYLLCRTDDRNTMVLTNKDLKVPEEYKDLDIEIDVDKDKYHEGDLSEENLRAIIKGFYKAGMVIKPKDDGNK